MIWARLTSAKFDSEGESKRCDSIGIVNGEKRGICVLIWGLSLFLLEKVICAFVGGRCLHFAASDSCFTASMWKVSSVEVEKSQFQWSVSMVSSYAHKWFCYNLVCISWTRSYTVAYTPRVHPRYHIHKIIEVIPNSKPTICQHSTNISLLSLFIEN